MSRYKKFGITSWAVDNKVTIYVLTVIITLLGIVTFQRLPKEQFPDIVVPTILVATINAGTSPTDVENLITRPIETQLKSVADVKKLTSQSIQDASIVVVEFTTGISPTVAKQRVNDAIDKARVDLPQNLTKAPEVQEIDFSEFPIMAVNIAGNVSQEELKRHADALQDKIEELTQIRRVDIIGALDKEVRVDLDPYRMQSLSVSFWDVSEAIRKENVNISGGDMVSGGMRRNIQVSGEFRSIAELGQVVVRSGKGNAVYLRDIASIQETTQERQSYARLEQKPVITLSVLKKAGENLIDASDGINAIVAEYQQKSLPKNMSIVITNDMSNNTRTNLADLINSIVIGFLLVTLLLMFFMGVQNALFVGLATPLSSFLAFLVMPGFDFTFNIVATFAFLLALGIVVDDAIVVVENTHRLHTKERIGVKDAAKFAAAEVFGPVVAGTLTTLAPFFPLLFWPGLVGEFMVYLPAVLIITLTASLIVAYIINPVFAVDFMDRKPGALTKNSITVRIVIALVVIGAALISGMTSIATLTVIVTGFWFLNRFYLTPVAIEWFQQHGLPKMMSWYRGTLDWFLHGWRPYMAIGSLALLLIVTFFLMAIAGPKVEFFPSGDPNLAYVYVQMPIGTDATKTDSVVRIVEERVIKILGPDNPMVQSVIANVGIGAGDPRNPDRTVTPHKGKVTVAFVQYHLRHGGSTAGYLTKFRDALRDLPGVEIVVDQEQNGPPTGKPINVEISGEDFETLVALSDRVRNIIVDSAGIQGIEKLKSDLVRNKPEISVTVDREKANREGVFTEQVGFALRSALYGFEASKYRAGEEEYPIQIRASEATRSDIDALLNLPMTFREMSSGQFRQIPVASVANVEYTTTYAGINRKNNQRVVSLGSNVLEGYNANEINAQIQNVLNTIDMPEGYTAKITGAQEEQKETSDFLGFAFMIAALIIFLIMVTQFNSIAKPILIMSTVLFSLIGVLLGFIIFQLPFSVVMTGVGIVALGGIVVRNGIVLLEFTDVLRERDGYSLRDAIIEGGSTRFNPVILTAGSTVLGLVPLAIGLNIDFASFLATLDPKFHIGSDSVVFWGPLAWAIIFGLTFSTFLTLVAVPCMYYILETLREKITSRFQFFSRTEDSQS
jgi:multidrug efflux pump subunit AcrB